MQSAVLHAVNELIQIEDRPSLVPSAHEAVVQIHAAALNHRDNWIRKGQYAGLKFPIVLGSDGVGTVSTVGTEVDSAWVGREVIVNPSLGWGQGQASQDFQTFNILGLPHDGTFAEEVVIPALNLAPKPSHLTQFEAAALPLAGLTAFRAVFQRAKLQPGEKILVTGAGGGAASFALTFAHASGAKVYVTTSTPEKLRASQEQGALGGAIYREGHWQKQLTEVAGGFDVIVDSAGGPEFSKLVDLANPGGRIVFFGATLGNPRSIDLRKIFWKQISLLGTTMGSPADFNEMLAFVSKHQIKPKVDQVLPLDQVNEAIDHMEKGNQNGKIVLQISTN